MTLSCLYSSFVSNLHTALICPPHLLCTPLSSRPPLTAAHIYLFSVITFCVAQGNAFNFTKNVMPDSATLTSIDRTLLFARPRVLSAAKLKENCFLLSFIAAPSCQTW